METPVLEPLDAIGLLPDDEIDLAEAALQLARIDTPDADWQAARRHLSALVRDAAAMVQEAEHITAQERAAALSHLLAIRHDYRGDRETYEAPDNANLIHVTERRRGLPVALGIVWIHVARAIGWDVAGIDFPGHFMIVLGGTGSQLVVDVFAGGAVADARALRRMLKMVEGQQAELRLGMLKPMTNRAVLLRLRNNIRTRHVRAGDTAAALACTLDMLRFAPDTALLWHDAALMHQQMDQVAAALRCHERFLALAPGGAAAQQAQDAINALRSRLN